MNRGFTVNFPKVYHFYFILLLFNFRTYAIEPIRSENENKTKLDSIANEKQYLKVLKEADKETFKIEFVNDFMLVLTKEQKANYLNLSSMDQCKRYIENYWKASNPNPILPENDVLKEHIRRRNYARKHFHSTAPPYFDGRGKYYIKYGEPLIRFQDSGGLKQLTFLAMRDDRNEDYTVRSNESWSYENIASDFVVHFAQIGQTFREIQSLTDIVITPRRRSKQAFQWSDIVKKRASISPALGRAAARIDEIETTLRTNTRSTLVRSEVVMPNERMLQIEKENKREIVNAINAAPASAHDPILAVNELDLYHTIEQFSGRNGLTRLEISLLSPIKKNLVRKEFHAKSKQVSIQFRGLLRNSHFVPVAEDQTAFDFPLNLAAKENIPNIAAKLAFFAPPQPFEITMQIKDEATNRIGFVRRLLQVRDFTGSDLKLSDIQFFTEVVNPKQRQVLPVTEKQNMVIAAYPYIEVNKLKPLLCYFEIYNIESAGIKDEYEITYKIVSTKKQKENVLEKVTDLLSQSRDVALSISYSQPVHRELSEELISIDLSKVSNGDYLLEIIVEASNDKSITAKVSRAIKIVE